MKLLRIACGIAVSVLLTACGGGVGTMALQPVQQVDESAPTFNLQAAYNNSITDTTPLAFKVEGVANGTPYTGTGSMEQSMLHSVSEFDAQGGALRKVMPVKMTLQVGGKAVQVDTTAHDFYTRHELRLVGRVAGASGEFTEVTTQEALPVEARVGASGTLYSAKRYSDNSRRQLTGTTTASYTLEPEGSSDTAALFVLRVADNKADGTPGMVTTTVFRIQGGSAKRVSETTVDALTHSTLKAIYS